MLFNLGLVGLVGDEDGQLSCELTQAGSMMKYVRCEDMTALFGKEAHPTRNQFLVHPHSHFIYGHVDGHKCFKGTFYTLTENPRTLPRWRSECGLLSQSLALRIVGFRVTNSRTSQIFMILLTVKVELPPQFLCGGLTCGGSTCWLS